MRNAAVAAILYAIFCVNEVAAAFIAQAEKRAVAEQTIEIFRPVRFMTREKFTLRM